MNGRGFKIKAVVLANVGHKADVGIDAEFFRNLELRRKPYKALQHFVYRTFLRSKELGWAAQLRFVPHGGIAAAYMQLHAEALREVIHVKEVSEVKDGLNRKAQRFGSGVAVCELKVVKTGVEFEANAVVEHVAVVRFVVCKLVNASHVTRVVHAVVAADREP